ncbi:hypothetical protein RF11_01058 [Thelohanellus kitauei]|uniref:Uncharacterized protein n=1 Tax=Thelohanellus kitauei TaxID=669202 RepID=A0A0C2ITG9_THEKT|nr:hypothetical protein RF11_01058 [Thelohanellus kitauei]
MILSTYIIKKSIKSNDYSVAPLFWGSNEANGMGNRTRSISQLSYILHKINTIKKIDGILRNGIGILCTNEVRSESSLLSVENSIPALGMTWTHAVTTRICIQKSRKNMNTKNKDGELRSVNTRLVVVKFSSHQPNLSAYIHIDEDGCHGIEEIQYDQA